MFFTLVHPHMSGFLVLVTCVQFVLGVCVCVCVCVWVCVCAFRTCMRMYL